MPKKERNVTCPRCHRSISGGEFIEHLRQHKGKNRFAQRVHTAEKRGIPVFDKVCSCGLRFKVRNEYRSHIKTCKQERMSSSNNRQKCSICSTSSYILLPYDDLMLCPSCSIGFFDSTKFFGAMLINHMGPEYEDILRKKIDVLLPFLGVNDLSELGINLVLIEFTQGMNQFMHSIQPNGELHFLFAQTSAIREQEKKVFEHVINHEVFHAHITHKLQLSVSDKLNPPFTFMESAAAQLAEDIQLEKIAVQNNVLPLITDEINRTTIFYENAPAPLPIVKWNTLPNANKLQSAISVTWTYSEESWLAKVLNDTKLRKQVSRNLELVKSHYSLHGYSKLKDLILELFNENIAKTEEEARSMFDRLLKVYDDYVDTHDIDLW